MSLTVPSLRFGVILLGAAGTMVRKSLLVAATLATAVMLSGCTAGLLEAFSLMGTDKTVGDHVISLASGKDCSTVREQQGQAYCKEDQLPPPKPNIYCYRNLGDVTCYDKPLPYGNYEPVDAANQQNIPLEKQH